MAYLMRFRDPAGERRPVPLIARANRRIRPGFSGAGMLLGIAAVVAPGDFPAGFAGVAIAHGPVTARPGLWYPACSSGNPAAILPGRRTGHCAPVAVVVNRFRSWGGKLLHGISGTGGTLFGTDAMAARRGKTNGMLFPWTLLPDRTKNRFFVG